MAVSRKAMTEGIRTFLFPGTPCKRNFTIPQSRACVRRASQLPLHKGALGAPAPVTLYEGSLAKRRFLKKAGGQWPPLQSFLRFCRFQSRFHQLKAWAAPIASTIFDARAQEAANSGHSSSVAEDRAAANS